jgi:hypothetical protein
MHYKGFTGGSIGGELDGATEEVINAAFRGCLRTAYTAVVKGVSGNKQLTYLGYDAEGQYVLTNNYVG